MAVRSVRSKKLAILWIIVFPVVLISTTWFFLLRTHRNDENKKQLTVTSSKTTYKDFGDLVTIIIRDFQLDRNDVIPTVRSFTKQYPNIKVYIISDETPYPPLEFTENNTNILIVNLRNSFGVSYKNKYPIFEIETEYVLFLPDSTRLPHKEILDYILYEAGKPNSIVAVPVTYTDLKCFKITHKIRQWTVNYELTEGSVCDSVTGKHATVLSSKIVKQLPHALLAPFPLSLYMQTSYFNYTVKILQGVIFQDGKPPLENRHVWWLRRQEEEALKNLYRRFKVKLVQEDGTEQWYGCTKNTTRCFPPVINSMPSYLYEKRWTPPCCLANLRKTAQHVFKNLDEAGIRYWLEAGSLLGAMRNSDILPWDYDVDVGINRDDVSRCAWLEKAKRKPVIDTKGFLWERAGDGNYFKVYFSKKNRIFVNLYPFYSKNGTMTRDGWSSSHKNMDFPDHFLHPMSSIGFAGRHVPSPNNIRDFLEARYGKGAIENPQYPDPTVMRFP